MSAFDTAIDCTRGFLECLNQNLFETPPYGPVPDASRKLRTAVDGMLDALTIAQSAESQGIVMPPTPEMPPDEVEGYEAHLRQEHTLHREHAHALAELDDARDTLTHWRPQTSTDQAILERARQAETRFQQEEAARRRQAQDNRGREEALRQPAQDRAEQERQERDRQSQAQLERDRQTQGQGTPQGQQPGQAPPQGREQEEQQRQERERQRQEQELQRQRQEQHERERQDRERHARESQEHERQFVSQAQPPTTPRPPEHTPGRE